MKRQMIARARVNVRLLVILLLVVVGLGVAAVAARQVRRNILASRALAAGQDACQRGDWPEARKQLREYLSRRPDDLPVLEQYAKAELSIEPIEERNIRWAVGAYRQLLRYDPKHREAYHELARLYAGMRNFDELGYITRLCLDHFPDDPTAKVWLAKSLITRRENDQASEYLLGLVEDIEQRQQKCPEYADACRLLSGIALQQKGENVVEEAFKWLDRAVAYDPNHAESYVARSRFYRTAPAFSGKSRAELVELARRDLEHADSLTPADPRVRLAIAAEWMELGDADRAAAQIAAIDGLPRETVMPYFLDYNDWLVALFVQKSELAFAGNDATASAAALADQTLGRLEQERHRIRVLPSAVKIYLSGRRIADARTALDEYLELLGRMEPTAVASEETIYLEAIVALAEGRPYRAIELLGPVVVRNPNRPLYWKVLAECYSQTGQARRAAQALAQYLEYRPGDTAALLDLLAHHNSQRDWASAVEVASRIERLDPSDPAGTLMRIEAAMHAAAAGPEDGREQAFSQLAAELTALRAAHPESADARVLQAMLAVARGRLDEAEGELKSMAAEDGDDALTARMQLARVYGRQGRLDDAIAVCREAYRTHAGAVAPYLTLAEIQSGLGRSAEAIATLRAGLDTVGEPRAQRDLRLKLALLEITSGDRQSGVAMLKDAAAADVYDVDARSLLLRLPEIRQDRAFAQTLVDEIRSTQGASGLLWRLHQASLWLDGDDWRSRHKEIGEMLSRCVESDLQWSAPVLLLGRMHEQLGELARAEQLYRRSLSANPGSVEVADRLVALLDHQDRYADAREVLDGLQVDPHSRSDRRVRMAIGAGQLDEAIGELRLRIADDPNDVESRVLLAQVLGRQGGHADEALMLLDQAQALHPGASGLLAARVAILQSAGRLDEASAVLDAAVAQRGDRRAHALRGAFHQDLGQTDLAEKDFVKLADMDANGQGYELLGRFYAETGRMDQAIETWRQGLEKHVENASLARRLIRALASRDKEGDRLQAMALLEDLEKRMGDDADLLLLRVAMMSKAEGGADREQVRPLLERAVQLNPMLTDAHLRLIELAFQNGDHAAARDLAIRALATQPDQPQLLLARAHAEHSLGDPTSALELAKMAVRSAPTDPEACHALASLAVSTQDRAAIDEARQALERALEARPDSDRLRLASALVLTAGGEREAAIRQLETHLTTRPAREDAGMLLALAELYRVGGQFDEAAQRIEQAERVEPNSPTVVRERVLLLAAQKKYDDLDTMIEAYRGRAEADPLVVYAAASALGATGSPDRAQRAMDLYEYVTQQAPQMVEARLGLALMAYHAGQTERAETLYQQVLDASPDNIQALNDLAWIVGVEDGRLEEGLQLADRGLRLAPRNLHLRDTRGAILAAMPDRLNDAKADFAMCVELSQDPARRARSLLQLARVCSQLGQTQEAHSHLEEALRIDREHKIFSPKERSEADELLRAGEADAGQAG